MTQDDFNLHYTLTTPISGGDRDGWDFSCESCGYHARYMLGDDNTQYKLEIIDAGDAHTRHIGPYAATPALDQYEDTAQAIQCKVEPEHTEVDESPFDEQLWLTAELRSQLSLILNRLDD